MQIENFKIIRSLGLGATSEVFEAYDPLADKNVALKVFSSIVLNDKDSLERLHGEVEALTRLRHPNVVTLNAQHQGAQFYALELELVKGCDFRQWNKNYKESLIEPYLWALAQIAKGLGAAHELEILHRDLKPENILVSNDGEIKITDFGLARQLDRLTITRLGLLTGSLGYMAPELINGGKATVKSDIFSFGVLAYEALAKTPPFTGETPQALLRSIVESGVAPLHEKNPIVPPRISKLVMACLRKDPAERPESIWTVEAEILGCLSTSRLLPCCRNLVAENQRAGALAEALTLKNRALRESIAAASGNRRRLLGLAAEMKTLFPNDETVEEILSHLTQELPRTRWKKRLAVAGVFILATSIFTAARWIRHSSPTNSKLLTTSPKEAPVQPVPAKIVKRISRSRGFMQFDADDDVSIFIDDRQVPRDLWRKYETSPGKKHLTLVKQGFVPIEKVVNVGSGKTVVINAGRETH